VHHARSRRSVRDLFGINAIISSPNIILLC
jgi:hypothetical protein